MSGNCSQCKLVCLFQLSIIGSVQFNLKGLLGFCGGTYSTCATYQIQVHRSIEAKYNSGSLLQFNILSFLADVHKPPVAHGDLSSSNVLVRADGTCAMCDFGCATILHSFLISHHRQNNATSMSVSRWRRVLLIFIHATVKVKTVHWLLKYNEDPVIKN